MEMRLARFGFGFMLLSSVGIAVYSLRYFGIPLGLWQLVSPGLQEVVANFPVRALIHMLIAPIALLVGPFQFIGSLRARHPRIHRYLGRVYVTSCVIAGAGGFATALHASGGPIAGFGFGLLAVLWVGTTLGGWWAAVQRRLELHRLLMRLSYAMTFGAVSLRLQIPLGLMLGYTGYPEMSVWLAYTAWIPNVIVVLVYTALDKRKRRAVQAGGMRARKLPGNALA